MTEPVYSYRKGAGWVPSTSVYETMTEQRVKYMVTLVRRTPEIGEGYFYMKNTETLEDVMKDLRNYGWTQAFEDESCQRQVGSYSGKGENPSIGEEFVTIILERTCP